MMSVKCSGIAGSSTLSWPTSSLPWTCTKSRLSRGCHASPASRNAFKRLQKASKMIKKEAQHLTLTAQNGLDGLLQHLRKCFETPALARERGAGPRRHCNASHFGPWWPRLAIKVPWVEPYLLIHGAKMGTGEAFWARCLALGVLPQNFQPKRHGKTTSGATFLLALNGFRRFELRSDPIGPH